MAQRVTAKRRKSRIGVVGLGYVGLPLAVEFGKQYETIGFDVNPKRVAQLRRGRDLTLEVTPAELKAARHLAVVDTPHPSATSRTAPAAPHTSSISGVPSPLSGTGRRCWSKSRAVHGR